jgi:predicted enzyme related to lactoylglutathione lyase
MIAGARYVHTNLIAHDWRALAAFYRSVFGCIDVPPERHFTAAEVEAATGVPGAGLRGMHLRLPGRGDGGPTLEIFSYSSLADRQVPVANRPGFAHIAFAVPSVPDARAQVLAAGGAAIGEVITLATSLGRVTWCYVTDPEGNIVELQAWTGE